MMNAKMNFKNNTLALAYATYMMVGSYYNRCTCNNPLKESQAYLAYCEAGTKLQYKLEEQAENYAKKVIFKAVPQLAQLMSHDTAEAFFKATPEGIQISFKSMDYTLAILCKYDHGMCFFKHAITTKTPSAAKAA